MNHEPMPGRAEREWCPVCQGPSGPDCPSRYRSKRSTRRMTKDDVRRAWTQAWLEGR